MDEAEFEALEMRLRDRAMLRRYPWLASAIVGSFFLWNEYHERYYWYIFKALRVDLPVPAQATYSMSRYIVYVTPFLAVAAIVVYYTKRRIVLKTFLVLMYGIFAGQLFAEALPLLIIQKALHTK